jgi:hypothetical protein
MQIEQYGETHMELSKISDIYHDPREFCDCLISEVNIAMTYCNDVDQWGEE